MQLNRVENHWSIMHLKYVFAAFFKTLNVNIFRFLNEIILGMSQNNLIMICSHRTSL